MKTGENQNDAATEETVVLDEETRGSLVKNVLESNPGKTEDDLKDQIAAAEAETVSAMLEQRKQDLARIDEIKSREGNAALTDEQAWELILEEEASYGTDDALFSDPFTAGKGKGEKATVDTDAARLARLAELEAIASDPLLSDIIEFRKNGGDIASFMANVGSVVDYDKVPRDEVIRHGLKMYLDANMLSQDEYEDEVASIESMSASDRIAKALAMKPMLIAAQKERLQKYAKQPSVNNEKMAELRKRSEEEVVSKASALIGKSYHGLNVPKEMADSIINEIRSGKLIYNEDGTVKAQTLIEAALWSKHKHEIIKAITEKAKTKGVLTERKKRAMPSRSTGVTTRPLDQSSRDAIYQKLVAEKIRYKQM